MYNIESVLVEDKGYLYASKEKPQFYDTSDTMKTNYFETIIEGKKNGEIWFWCIDYNSNIVKEINSRYVIEVNYKHEDA
jgi:hypothetical protein